jgi:hypothetical protein
LWKSPTPSVSSDAEPQLLPIQQPQHLMQPQPGDDKLLLYTSEAPEK